MDDDDEFDDRRVASDLDDLAALGDGLDALSGLLAPADFTQALASKALLATGTGHAPPFRSNQPSMGVPAASAMLGEWPLGVASLSDGAFQAASTARRRWVGAAARCRDR